VNAILLIIDSLDYTRCQSSAAELLPNIKKRAQKSYSAENMYSQSPYTEAATIALYCGQNTLDNHGYIERFNNAEYTLFEVLKAAGYETFFNTLQPQCYPSSLRRGIDNIRYNRGFDNPALWAYRFEYYTQKYKDGKFNEIDFIQLCRILKDNFVEWIRFLDDLIIDDKSVCLIKKLNNQYNAQDVKKLVQEEKLKFEADNRKYILDIFANGENHNLFKISFFDQIDYELSGEAKDFYNKEIGDFVKRIRIKNFFQNLIFNHDIFPAYLDAIKCKLKGDKKGYIQRSLIIRNALLMNNNNKKYGEMCHSLKGQPSINEHIKSFIEWLDERKSDRPYFATIHVDDIHYPEMFFSYESNDVGLLSEELKTAYNCMKNRRCNDKGTISLDLSLRYVDLKCEQFISELEKRGKLEDTVIFVTADHGFSYSGFPIRDRFVNSFYLENFKIPFFIYGSKVEPGTDLHLRSSLDIPATICQVLGIDAPESFVGESVISAGDDDRVLTIEYCGGGCPDINDKALMIAAFDNEYMVAGLFKLRNGYDSSSVTEIYNLKTDPLQRKNLKGKIDINKLRKYTDVIESRLEKISDTNQAILKTF
jgi:hypothetical protein